MRFPILNFVIYLGALCAELSEPRDLRQDYDLDSEKKVAEAKGRCKTIDLAPQARVYHSSWEQDLVLAQTIRSTSLSWTELQQELCLASLQSSNAAEDYKATEGTFVEAHALQENQQRAHRVVPQMLGTLVSDFRPNFCGPPLPASGNANDSERKTVNLGFSGNPSLARGTMVAPTEPEAFTKCLQTGQSQAKEGRGCGEKGIRHPIRHLISFPLLRIGWTLCNQGYTIALATEGVRQQGTVQCLYSASFDCRHGGGHQGILPRSQGYAIQAERDGSEIRYGRQEVLCQGHRKVLDLSGDDAGEVEGPEGSQTESSHGMVEKLGRNYVYLGGTLQILCVPTRRVRSSDLRGYHRDGNYPLIFGQFVQTSWRRSPKRGGSHRCRGRPSCRRTGEIDAQEGGFCASNLLSYGRSSCDTSRQQLRRRWEREGKRWRWSQEGWTWQRRCFVTIGSSQPCLRNSCCEPQLIPKKVRFDIAECDVHSEPGDGTTPNLSQRAWPHSILLDDDCIYSFQAYQVAAALSLELLVEKTTDILWAFRMDDDANTSPTAPLSPSEAVLSRDCNLFSNNSCSHKAPLSLREAVSGRDCFSPYNCNYEPPWPRRQYWSEPIDIPGLPLEGRPFIDHMPIWVQQIHQGVFHDQAEVEHRDDGPVLCLMTWYLHDTNQRICAMPRVVQFDVYYEQWEAVIRENDSSRGRHWCLPGVSRTSTKHWKNPLWSFDHHSEPTTPWQSNCSFLLL